MRNTWCLQANSSNPLKQQRRRPFPPFSVSFREWQDSWSEQNARIDAREDQKQTLASVADMMEPCIICILYSVHTGACTHVQLLHLYVYSPMSMHFDCQFSRTRDELIHAWDVIWQTSVGDAYFQFWGHPWHPLIRAMMWPYIILSITLDIWGEGRKCLNRQLWYWE